MKKWLFYVSLFMSISLWAQVKRYSSDYFMSPIKQNMTLAGNFGEIRPDHFHSGIDIRTQGREGIPIYAVADGYISRIKISPYGYGKTLYINHPNGFTSVYAHLKNFTPLIDSVCKSIQYSKQSFEIDTLFKEKFTVKKGELIGYSGNTGSSQAPHLHFEIRDSKTEIPINPLHFGYKINDNIPPTPLSLSIYPMDEKSSVNEVNKVKRIKILPGKDSYILDPKDSIIAHGFIGFGIECFDTENGSVSKQAVYSIELLTGNKRAYYAEFEKFAFEDTKYVNAHIDYGEKLNKNSKIQKCFVVKNNRLDIYQTNTNNGVLLFNDDNIHWVRIILKDFNGNTSKVEFKIQSSAKEFVPNAFNTTTSSLIFKCTDANLCKKENIEIVIPEYALYEDVVFNLTVSEKLSGYYSPIYKIHNEETPLHKPYTLKINAQYVPEKLRSKACVASISKKGKLKYEGGTYENGYIVTETRNFGKFVVTADTTGPYIVPKFKINDKQSELSFADKQDIRFTVQDNLSGIKSYSAFINDKWVLLEYDAKSNTMFYTFDNNIKSGKHTFRIEVTDKKNNKNTYQFNFLR
jgi:hypothetical protein